MATALKMSFRHEFLDFILFHGCISYFMGDILTAGRKSLMRLNVNNVTTRKYASRIKA